VPPGQFHGAVGVQVSHAQYTTLDRLELRHLTYGGISVGWGWARHVQQNGTYSSDNAVTRTRIHHFKTLLGDGGGIYALGPQPRSVMRGNWLHDMAAGRGGGAFYPYSTPTKAPPSGASRRVSSPMLGRAGVSRGLLSNFAKPFQ
jgi:hypothetical protein